MKKRLAIGAVLMLVALAGLQLARHPQKPSRIVVAEVVALADDGTGRRTITVRFDDGRELAIETLAPFFFKPGYKAKVGIYERPFLPDRYGIVGDWTVDIQS